MKWRERYPDGVEPSMEDIAEYIGGAKGLWLSLVAHFEAAYGAKPKLQYSSCGMKPGWNVKYQKSGQSFGTLYPMENAFDAMVVIGYKLAPAMELALPELSGRTAELYRAAGDYMGLGKWMMLTVDSEEALADYERICAVKLAPRGRG